MNTKNRRVQQRIKRTRSGIEVTSDRFRLSVYRSGKHIYAQVIGLNGKVVAAAKGSATIEGARKVGLEIAENAKSKKIKKVVFDRGEYKYHGKVKALAEGARKGGLEF